ncbi:MAG TPA: formylglycine-generating enzyme family protein, partial [Myxococcota bacterium]|nr:formylglycine-generating enzyme family protein [Myxococcota bacterium]
MILLALALTSACHSPEPPVVDDLMLPAGIHQMPAAFDCERSHAIACYLPVAGATFRMGAQASDPAAPSYDPAASAGEGPVHEVTVSPFWIQRHEASTNMARRCLESGACGDAEFASGEALLNRGTDRVEHPINGVTWEGARQLCAWLGARMPTEAEWELAARGTDGRRWPWGNERACPTVGVDPKQPWELQRTDPPCRQHGTLPFNDLRGPSASGAIGMGGNVWEWVSDWYAEDAYASSASRDPRGPATGARRVQRGGGWMEEDPDELRATNRIGVDPGARLPDVGVRCARDVVGDAP